MIALAHVRAAISGAPAQPFDISFLNGSLDPRVSFARASQSLVMDATGRLTYAPNNLALNSLLAGAVAGSPGTPPTSWPNVAAVGTLTSSAGGVSGGSRIRVVTSASRYCLRQNVNVAANTRYIYSIRAEVIASTNIGNLFDIRLLPAGAQLAYYMDGALAPASGVPVGQRLLHAVLDVGDVAGVVNLQFGLGVAGNFTGEAVFDAPQFEAVTYQTSPRPYLPTASTPSYAPRFEYDPATLAPLGLMVEPARTNVVLRNRDLASATWIKSGVTALRDQVGLDGVANSASRITATSANGSCLQALTLASSERFQTAYVKRIAGSGPVAMTMDGGLSWTTVAVGSTWGRVSMPAQTLGDPRVGFKLAVSGDVIAVDLVQNENAASASGPIATDTVAASRAASVVKFTPPAGVNAIRFALADGSTLDAPVTPGVETTIPTNFGRGLKSLARV